MFTVGLMPRSEFIASTSTEFAETCPGGEDLLLEEDAIAQNEPILPLPPKEKIGYFSSNVLISYLHSRDLFRPPCKS